MLTRTMPRGRNMLVGAILVAGDANALPKANSVITATARVRVQQERGASKQLEFIAQILSLIGQLSALPWRALLRGRSCRRGCRCETAAPGYLTNDRHARTGDSTSVGPDRHDVRRRHVLERDGEHAGCERDHRAHFAAVGLARRGVNDRILTAGAGQGDEQSGSGCEITGAYIEARERLAVTDLGDDN